MTKSVKVGAIILIFVLMVVLVTTTALTYAKWNAGSGGGDSGEATTYGPVADSTNWNVYAKYFKHEAVDGGLAITGFDGGNLEDIIIPTEINGTPVVAIKNIFTETTLKTLPVTVKIPYTVTSIAATTFQNCTNLQTVIFGSYLDPEVTPNPCICGSYLFAGCVNLSKVEVYGNRQVQFGAFDFIGCTSLTTAPTYRTVYLKFRNGESDDSYYITGSASNITYATDATTGASFTIT